MENLVDFKSIIWFYKTGEFKFNKTLKDGIMVFDCSKYPKYITVGTKIRQETIINKDGKKLIINGYLIEGIDYSDVNRSNIMVFDNDKLLLYINRNQKTIYTYIDEDCPSFNLNINDLWLKKSYFNVSNSTRKKIKEMATSLYIISDHEFNNIIQSILRIRKYQKRFVMIYYPQFLYEPPSADFDPGFPYDSFNLYIEDDYNRNFSMLIYKYKPNNIDILNIIKKLRSLFSWIYIKNFVHFFSNHTNQFNGMHKDLEDDEVVNHRLKYELYIPEGHHKISLNGLTIYSAPMSLDTLLNHITFGEYYKILSEEK